MDTLLQDIRFGRKLLWKEKAFSATVLLTLAVCMGANTTIFSVMNPYLFRPLPFGDAEQLVQVNQVNPRTGQLSGGRVSFSTDGTLGSGGTISAAGTVGLTG